MKIKCITCNKKFLSNVVFNQHSCVKAYDEKTLEQLLQEYNSSKKWINVNELPKCEMVDPRTDSAGRWLRAGE